jgi:hypothetical protein
MPFLLLADGDCKEPAFGTQRYRTGPGHAIALPERGMAFTTIRRIWHDHGLSIVLVVLFLGAMWGQTLTGWKAYNAVQAQHGERSVTLAAYLGTGHFGEATFENWESEFLQMAFYVLLTAFLYQRGSSESKRPDTIELVDLDPRASPDKSSAPGRSGAAAWCSGCTSTPSASRSPCSSCCR